MRAYQIINEGKKEDNILCPKILKKGKFHSSIAYELSQGRGLFVLGGQWTSTYRIDIYEFNAETGLSCFLECDTKNDEEAILRAFERLKEKYAKGKPIRKYGRPKKSVAK